MRAGRPVFNVTSPISGCSEISSFAPNPPPAAIGIIRTRSGGRPRIAAVSSRSIAGAWVQARITSVSPSIHAMPASGSI